MQMRDTCAIKEAETCRYLKRHVTKEAEPRKYVSFITEEAKKCKQTKIL